MLDSRIYVSALSRDSPLWTKCHKGYSNYCATIHGQHIGHCTKLQAGDFLQKGYHFSSSDTCNSNAQEPIRPRRDHSFKAAQSPRYAHKARLVPFVQ